LSEGGILSGEGILTVGDSVGQHVFDSGMDVFDSVVDHNNLIFRLLHLRDSRNAYRLDWRDGH